MKTRLILLSFVAITFTLYALAAHGAGDPRHVREQHQQQRYDNRYDHNRSYPVRGYVAPALPRGYVNVRYRGAPYYFYGGTWYRPYGPRYIVARPPFGIGIAYLPPFYTTVWFGGVP